MIHRIQQDMIVSKEYAPHPHQSPNYGAKVQIYLPPDDAIPLHNKFIYRNKETVGTELYYDRAVDSIKIFSPIDLSTEQIKNLSIPQQQKLPSSSITVTRTMMVFLT